MISTKPFALGAGLALLALAPSAPAAAAGVSGPAFYIDGELYRTVATPTDLPQDAPDDTFAPENAYAFHAMVRRHRDVGDLPAWPGGPRQLSLL